MTFSGIFLFGMYLNWYLYTRHERVDRVFPDDLPKDDKTLDIEEENSIEVKARTDYYFEEINIFVIEGVNYYSRLDEITVMMDQIEKLYFELFDKETEMRKQAEHSSKIAQLVKLRAFEL